MLAPCRADLEPILVASQVNVMLFGHTHYYERTCTMKFGECTKEAEGGVLYLCVGTGGHVPSSDGDIWEPWKARRRPRCRL